MANTPETKVKKRIDKVLKPYVQRKVMAYNKTAGSMYGSNGWPDYDGVLLGFFWSIEAKHHPNKPSDLQKVRINDIKGAGGIALVVDETNVDRLDDFFRRLEERAIKLRELLRASS